LNQVDDRPGGYLRIKDHATTSRHWSCERCSVLTVLPTVERVQRLVSDAVANGATVLTAGGSDGTVMKGIVVDRVTPEMQLFREESFGPQV
jgi:Aldehyde dehydrogenase family